METSAKTGVNVDLAFMTAAKWVLHFCFSLCIKWSGDKLETSSTILVEFGGPPPNHIYSRSALAVFDDISKYFIQGAMI